MSELNLTNKDDLEKSFFSLGRTSVEAIKIVRTLRREGYKTDIKTLLKSKKISDFIKEVGE